MTTDLQTDRTELLLRQVADDDVAGLIKAGRSYGDSWKRRGGIGAFMMLARKWDRIENQVGKPSQDLRDGRGHVEKFDVFRHVEVDTRPEGIMDDIRDLRRYLMLVETEMRRRGAESALSVSRDNKAPPPPIGHDPLYPTKEDYDRMMKDFPADSVTMCPNALKKEQLRWFREGVRWRESHVQAGGADSSEGSIVAGYMNAIERAAKPADPSEEGVCADHE